MFNRPVRDMARRIGVSSSPLACKGEASGLGGASGEGGVFLHVDSMPATTCPTPSDPLRHEPIRIWRDAMLAQVEQALEQHHAIPVGEATDSDFGTFCDAVTDSVLRGEGA